MNIIERFLNWSLPKRVIVNCDHDPYLHRWYLFRCRWFGIFIHKFVRSDEDRALHDHPWSFLVIPIWRGYYEHSERRRHLWNDPEQPSYALNLCKRVYPIIGTRYRKAEYRHRVELLKKKEMVVYHGDMNNAPDWVEIETEKPSWSIFIRFRSRRVWGFHTPEGFIEWNKWWQDKCE